MWVSPLVLDAIHISICGIKLNGLTDVGLIHLQYNTTNIVSEYRPWSPMFILIILRYKKTLFSSWRFEKYCWVTRLPKLWSSFLQSYMYNIISRVWAESFLISIHVWAKKGLKIVSKSEFHVLKHWFVKLHILKGALCSKITCYISNRQHEYVGLHVHVHFVIVRYYFCWSRQ